MFRHTFVVRSISNALFTWEFNVSFSRISLTLCNAPVPERICIRSRFRISRIFSLFPIRTCRAAVHGFNVSKCTDTCVHSCLVAQDDTCVHAEIAVGVDARVYRHEFTRTHHVADPLYVLLALRHATLSSPRTHSCIRALTRDPGIPSARDRTLFSSIVFVKDQNTEHVIEKEKYSNTSDDILDNTRESSGFAREPKPGVSILSSWASFIFV